MNSHLSGALLSFVFKGTEQSKDQDLLFFILTYWRPSTQRQSAAGNSLPSEGEPWGKNLMTKSSDSFPRESHLAPTVLTFRHQLGKLYSLEDLVTSPRSGKFSSPFMWIFMFLLGMLILYYSEVVSKCACSNFLPYNCSVLYNFSLLSLSFDIPWMLFCANFYFSIV